VSAVRRLLLLAAVFLVAACGTDEEPVTPPSASPSPSVARTADPFPDVTRDGGAIVLLLRYNPADRAAVVEPAVFLPGLDYCKALRVDPIDRRCSREYVIEGSKTKVTLPLAEKVQLRGTGTGEPECLGTMTEGTKCPVNRDYIASLAESESPVHITVRDGEIVRIAEMYHP